MIKNLVSSLIYGVKRIDLVDFINRNVVLILFMIALIQCLSVWNYGGDNVDESELVHFAVGFLGGDLNPAWFGYGSLGMYILAMIYFIFGKILILLGAIEDWISYGALLFDSGVFFILARILFALLGVTTVYIYYRSMRNIGLPRFVLLPFLVAGFLGIDALSYANYVRTDQLVSLFFAVIFLIAMESAFKIRNLLLISFVCAASVSSKISSITILVVVLYSLFQNIEDNRSRLKWFIVSMVIFILGTLLFQPYQDILTGLVEMYNYRLSGDDTFNFGKAIYLGFVEHLQRIIEIVGSNISWELSYLIFLSPVLFHKNRRLLFLSILMIGSFVAPYFFHWEVTNYWFVPVFPLLKLLGIVSLYYFLLSILGDKNLTIIKFIYFSLTIVTIIVYTNGYLRFSKQILSREMNRTLSYDWVLMNKGIDTILVDHHTHVLPKFYFGNDMSTLRNVSRTFMFNRANNRYLNLSFERFLEERDSSWIYERHVVKVKVFDVLQDSVEQLQRQNKYFMTAPNIYQRFTNNDGKRYSESRLNELEYFRRYYKWMLRGNVVKRFDDGSGPIIEVWQIP